MRLRVYNASAAHDQSWTLERVFLWSTLKQVGGFSGSIHFYWVNGLLSPHITGYPGSVIVPQYCSSKIAVFL